LWVDNLKTDLRKKRYIWLRLLDARLSFITVALGALVLYFPQGRDVVRDLVDYSSNQPLSPDNHAPHFFCPTLTPNGRWALFLLACIWSGINAWYWPHLLTLSRTSDREWRFRYVRRLLGLTPLGAAICTIYWCGRDNPRNVGIELVVFIMAALGLYCFFVVRQHIVDHRFKNAWWRHDALFLKSLFLKLGGRDDVTLSRGDETFILSTFAFTFLALLVFSLPATRVCVSVALGSAAIAFGAVGSIITGVSALVWLMSGTSLPVIGLALVAILLFSTTNDNHQLHIIDPKATDQRIDIDHAYKIWAKQPGNGGLLVLVATAGGASRAAYWTGDVLRTLDNQTGGAFAKHVFAISSVSGGTLGAFGYAAWVANHPVENCGYHAGGRLRFDQSFLGDDYLSPAISGLLYPDLIQRFFFRPFLPDRAQTLEQGWEEGWAKAVSADPPCTALGHAPKMLSDDMMSIWDEALKGGPWVPLVLANGTLVEDGKRVITAPVQIEPQIEPLEKRCAQKKPGQNGPRIFEDSHDFFRLLCKGSISASTAILNSARFPLVSPAGTIPQHKGDYHIVDGGYFENGGLETVYDLARHLRTIKGMPAILIIEINNDDGASGSEDQARYPNIAGASQAATSPSSLAVEMPAPSSASPAEGVTAIAEAFFRTRESHNVLAAKRLSSLKAIGLSDTYRVTFNLGPVIINRRTAMSWSLSLSSRQAMDTALQNPASRQDEQIRCQGMAIDAIAAALTSTSPHQNTGCDPYGKQAAWVGWPIGLPASHFTNPNRQVMKGH